MLILLCVLSLALAEPPVGDSYLEAAESTHDHSGHAQYLPPDLSVPSVRTFKAPYAPLLNQNIANSRGISQEYGLPDFRVGLSQEYGTPIARIGASGFRNAVSQEYGAPSARVSQQYNSFGSHVGQRFSSASLRNGVSQRYGAPSSRTLPSSVYGPPLQRSSASTIYGAPELQSTPEEYSTSFHTSYITNRNSSPVQKYGVPGLHSSQSRSEYVAQEYGTPSRSNLESRKLTNTFQRTRNDHSQIYGTPARSLSTLYGAPEARNGVAHSTELARAYGAPSERSLSQEYGVPEIGTSGHGTNAISSSYSSERSPSQEYGVPSSRTLMPSHQYGALLDSVSDQGYQYARNALDLFNQEPANYEFAYKVSDYESGSDFGHVESRQLDRAEGVYFVLLPDGTKQVVEYEADEDGFKPRISVEPADSPSDRAADGPY